MMAVSLVLTPVSDPCNYETPSTTAGASDNPAGILKTAQNLKTYRNYLLSFTEAQSVSWKLHKTSKFELIETIFQHLQKLSQFLENCTKPQNLNLLKLSFKIYRSSASFLKTAQNFKIWI